MSGPSPKKSPFKAVAAKNATHCGFISMSLLEPHKAYMMTDMKVTHHATYGDGLLSFLKGRNNSQWRSQFPPKYLQNFTAEDIEALRDQIKKGKYPFIIFREVLADKSFKIDLAPYSEELVNAHNKWLDVGAIVLSPDTSVEDISITDGTAEENSSGKDIDKNTNPDDLDGNISVKRRLDDANDDSNAKKLHQDE